MIKKQNPILTIMDFLFSCSSDICLTNYLIGSLTVITTR